MATADFLLKIKGIDGESTQKGYEKNLELTGWSWGETNAGSMAAGTGGGVSKVSMQDFHFSIVMGKHTPNTMLYCAMGQHIDECVLTCRKPTGKDGGQEKYLEIKFTSVVITSYQAGGSDGGTLPQEQISFNFTKIELEYFAQDDKGILKSVGKTGYDLKIGTKV